MKTKKSNDEKTKSNYLFNVSFIDNFNKKSIKGTNYHCYTTRWRSNASVLQRIITPLQENTVYWNNQSSSTNANGVVLPESNIVNQDYIANVTLLIQDTGYDC